MGWRSRFVRRPGCGNDTAHHFVRINHELLNRYHVFYKLFASDYSKQRLLPPLFFLNVTSSKAALSRKAALAGKLTRS